MKTRTDVERLEKVIGQLHGAHSEISILSKKSQNDSLNAFKLGLVNKILEAANSVLGEKYNPVHGFDKFDPDDAPTVSDVTMILSQYMEEAERFRSDNVTVDFRGWWYVLGGEQSNIRAGQPTKVGKK